MLHRCPALRGFRSLVRVLGLLLALGACLSSSPAHAAKRKKPPPAEAQQPVEEPFSAASGDEEFGPNDASRPGMYTLRSLIQTRITETAPDMAGLSERIQAEDPGLASVIEGASRDAAENDDGLRLERVFLRATATPTKAFSLKLLVDFGELVRKNQKKALKLAFGEFRPTRALTVTVGLFKIPFSLLELLPIAEFELANVGPTDDLIKDLGFGGRDVGAMLEVAPLKKKKWLEIQGGIFQGDSVGAQHYSAPGILAFRADSRPIQKLRLGVDCAMRIHSVTDRQDALAVPYEKYASGMACSADATVAYKKLGLRAEGMTGNRVDTPEHPGGNVRNFMAAWAIVSYRLKLRGKLALLPAARFEWLDEDESHDYGIITSISGGIALEFFTSTRLLFDLTRQNVQVGTRYRGDSPVYRPSTTTGVVQMQLVL
jgi:hypothetical protein